MNPHDPKHLTADELDTFLVDNSSHLVASHLATCAACARMVEQDARLIAALSTLPYFTPSIEFTDRVMRNITPVQVAQPAVVVVTSARALAARRRALGGLVVAGGSLAALFAWASTHPTDALRWSGPALQDAGHSLWISLQSVVANTSGQPWFVSARDAMTTPLRALLVLGAGAGAYALALLGLRRLMTEPATDAAW